MGLYGPNGPFLGYLTAEEIKRGMALASEALTAIEAEIERRAAGDVGSAADATAKVAVEAAIRADVDVLHDAAILARLTQGQGDARYRLAAALIGVADLGFDPATQVELDDAILTRASQVAHNAEIAARVAADVGHADAPDPHAGYRMESALIGPGDLAFDVATQVELDEAIAARIAADNLRALLTDKRFNQIVQQVGWYLGVLGVPGSLALGTGLTGNIYVLPVTLGKPITIDQLWHNVTVAGGAGSFNELAVYGDNGNFWPGPLLAQVTVPTDVVGVALASIPPTVIPAGPVWLATRINTVTTSATVISIQGSQVGSLFPATNIGFVTTNYGGGLLTLNNAALPNPYFPENTPVAHFVVNGAPRVLMRRSA